MASVCGGTLALLDAGIKLTDMVSGVAMGLVTRNTEAQVLTDIIGMEDFMGDMDFKFAGTRLAMSFQNYLFQVVIQVLNIIF